MRTCPKCKKTIENDKALFCRYCGHELSVPVAPPPVPKQEPEGKPKPKVEEKNELEPAPEEKPKVIIESDSDDDVEIVIVKRPSSSKDEIDLLDVPTGISTYLE